MRFLGAAGTVTGSKTLLADGDGGHYLVDAGLFQGLRALRRRNWAPFPLDPACLDAVLLTHAHLDHCGYLPALVRQGMQAPVLGTPGTLGLVSLVLRDSAMLQEEDARYAAQAGYSKHARPEPLYSVADVERTLPMLTEVDFFRPLALPVRAGRPAPPGTAEAVWRPAGHILGSSVVEVRLAGSRVAFTGDLGRGSHPLLVPPAPPPEVDALVVESTYGDRRHDGDVSDGVAALGEIIRSTARRGGVVLIPAFAVDRTEVILLALRQLMSTGSVPPMPVYVDSPMALGALAIYRRALAQGAADVRSQERRRARSFDPGDLREVHDAAGSMAINAPTHPCVIVSASGMAAGGRVVHHLKHLLPDPRNTIVLVGFQAAGTRGRSLADGATQVKMHGRYVPVRADVAVLHGFSVHADAAEMLGWLAQAPKPPSVVYVVHGEPSASAALADRIRAELGWTAVVARDGEVVRLD